MKFRFTSSLLTIAALSASFGSHAQDLIIFPAGGQTAEQQEQDQFTCYNWSKNETGFDPMATPTASAPPPAQEAPKGGALKGAAGGAIVGGIVDGSDGAKTGAAAGAAVGIMRKNRQQRSQASEQAAYQQQQTAQYDRRVIPTTGLIQHAWKQRTTALSRGF
ncbi:MAG: glycine zipper family protein [Proteobacteria bacterium]|nr:glycine zipper family protein [Pseudomonadota bacterium]